MIMFSVINLGNLSHTSTAVASRKRQAASAMLD